MREIFHFRNFKLLEPRACSAQDLVRVRQYEANLAKQMRKQVSHLKKRHRTCLWTHLRR